MKRTFAFLFCFWATLYGLQAQNDGPLRVFIRAGAKTHGPGQHDHPRFLQEWSELLKERGATVDGALNFPIRAQLTKTDVLILYCAEGGSIAGADRQSLEEFLGRGGGIVVLHDAICGTNADWFKTVVGGAWEHGRARWQEGKVGLYVQDYQHPITQGLSNFDLTDEMYHQLHMMPDVKVLASTFRTAKEIVPQIWTYEKERYRAFVSIPGHNHVTFALPQYRGLLLRGIAWAGKRPVDLFTRTNELAAFAYPRGGPTAPDQAATKLTLNPEFELSLVAAEPLVVKPISLDWDARGRMWVAVTPEYPFKVDSSPAKDSILILQDTDGDGRMDRKQVFYEGLTLVTSFVFHRDGVIVAQAPQILFLRDQDGDGRAESRAILFDGFGREDTHAVISNFRWGMDGWIYGTQGYSGNKSENITGPGGQKFGKIGNGVFRFRPDGSAMEMVASYSGNSWGLDFTWEGELFFSKANGPHVSHLVMPERFFLRGRIGGALSDKAVEDHSKVSPIFGDTRHEYVQVSPVGSFTAASGAMIYEGATWPAKYHGSYFVSEPTVHIVHEDIFSTLEDSPTYEATRREEAEFMAGTDLWFRPVHTRFGPDGAVYVLDFYNQAISHNDIRGIAHGPGNAAVRPDRDHLHGRIWRVQHRQAWLLDVPPLQTGQPADWVRALQHPNLWVRMTAQRLLVETRPEGVAENLTALLRSSRQAYTRTHALWCLQQLGLLSEEDLLLAIADPHWGVQKNVFQLIASGAAPLSVAVERTVLKQLTPDSIRVRLHALWALGQGPSRKSVVSPVLKIYPDLKDAWTKSAVLYVATLAPLEFMKEALDSDKADSFRDLAAKLIEHVTRHAQESVAADIIIDAAGHSEKKDKLKIAVLEAIAPKIGTEFAPEWSEKFGRALEKLLENKNRAVRVAALPLAAHYNQNQSLSEQTREITKDLMAELRDREAKEEDRIQLLTGLMGIAALQNEVITAMDAMLENKASSAMQKQIITEIGRSADPEAGTVLAQHFRALSSENRPLAFATLTRRHPWALALLNKIKSGEVRLQDLGATAVNRLRNYPDAAVAQKAQEIIDGLQGAPVKEKETLIARFNLALDQPADVRNGQTAFEKNCAVCHRLDGKGKDLGPDLTGSGWHGPGVLLVHILDPNRVVEGNYISYNATTRKQEDYFGLLTRENRDSVVLRNLEGETEIRRSDLATIVATGHSMMPEGFEALGQETVRDVIAYLVEKAPKGFRAVDLNGAFTADSRKGLYAVQNDKPQLDFKRFGTVVAEGVPFQVINPATATDGRNVIVLKGGTGFARTLPQRVEIPFGAAADRLHILGGIAGWGYPYGSVDGHHIPAAKVTFHYEDGPNEEIVLTNGHEIADYKQRIDVPGSVFVPGVTANAQLRSFTLTPKRGAPIQRIVLESYNNHLAPTFVAITAQVTP